LLRGSEQHAPKTLRNLGFGGYLASCAPIWPVLNSAHWLSAIGCQASATGVVASSL